MTELIPDIDRQASSIFRGYAYQAYQTICAWLKCAPGEEILTEFAEDLDLIRRDLDGNVTNAELSQVKHEKGNITLNSKAASDLINHFFQHKRRNPSINLSIRLCTISDRGKEKNMDWVYAECGMDLWDLLKKREFNEDNQKKATVILRSFFQQNNKISGDVQRTVKEFDDLDFLKNVIDHISWDTGQQSYGDIEEKILKMLSNLPRPITDPAEVRQVIDRLWRYVTDVMADDTVRSLKHEDIEYILAQETSVTVDRMIVKKLSSDAAETKETTKSIEKQFGLLLQQLAPDDTNLDKRIELLHPSINKLNDFPPLPKICSDRSVVIEDIEHKCGSHLVTWIYGSTGYGKTVLANLYVRKLDRSCFWFRLRDLIDFDLISYLQLIISILQAHKDNQLVIVIDDLKIGNQNTYCFELLSNVANILRQRESQLLITSQLEPPVRFKSDLDQEICMFDAPEMSIDDISMMLNDVGLTDKKTNEAWSKYILAMTSGHPQLVSAYVVYAREKNWKLANEEFFKKPRPVEEVKAESRKLLAETIQSDEARELARRLSVAGTLFDREFALNVGLAVPSLKEPGRSFDALVGPWIEAIGSDMYSLSPLLGGYAEAEVGQAGLQKYYKSVCYAWLKKRTLTIFEFLPLLTTALIAKMGPLIAKVCYTLMNIEPEQFKHIAKNLSLLSFFYVGTDDRLSDLDPFSRFMFRHIQLKIAKYNADWSNYTKIDEKMLQEIEEIEGQPFYREFQLMHLIDTSLSIDSPIPVKLRITRTLKALNFQHYKTMLPEDILLSDQIPIGTVSMIATSKINTQDDLKFLLDQLNQQPPEILSEFFAGFDEYPESLSLLIDRVWLFESQQRDPQWISCEDLFSKFMSFAKKHENSWLLAAAARGRMVILDEYMKDPDRALKVAAEARSMIKGGHPLIDLAESMVLFRQQQYKPSLERIESVEASLPVDILTLSRVFALRRGIESATKLESWKKVTRFAIRGQELSKVLEDKPSARVVWIAFEAEIGWASHESENSIEATQHFKRVLSKMEVFSDQKHPQFHILRLRFGHTLGWLNTVFLREDDASGKKSQRPLERPFAGMFANFEDPPEESKEHRAPSYPLSWGLLAMYAAWAVEKDIVTYCAKRAMVKTDNGQYYLAVLNAWEALFWIQLTTEDFDSALRSGFQYVKALVLGSEFQTVKKEEWKADEVINLESKFNDVRSTILNKWYETSFSLILEPLLMAMCSLDSLPDVSFSKWAEYLQDIFGTEKEITISLNLIETGVHAALGDQQAADKIKEYAQDSSQLPKVSQRFPFLAYCAFTSPSPVEVLSAQATILMRSSDLLRNRMWVTSFYKMVAKRWIFLAEKQRFMLSAPQSSAAAILEATSLPKPKCSDCANLLLVVGDAVRVKWPQEMLTTLRELMQSK